MCGRRWAALDYDLNAGVSSALDGELNNAVQVGVALAPDPLPDTLKMVSDTVKEIQ